MDGLLANDAHFTIGDAATDTQRARYLHILNTALEVLREVGYPQATMESIAARSGVGLGTIYRYFKSRDKLLYLATDAWIRREALGARQQHHDKSPRDQVFDSIRESAERMIAEPHLLKGWISANLSSDPDVIKLAARRNFISELNKFTFLDQGDSRLQESLTAVMENFFFGALVRWCLGHRTWEQLLADVDAAVRVVFTAHPAPTAGHPIRATLSVGSVPN